MNIPPSLIKELEHSPLIHQSEINTTEALDTPEKKQESKVGQVAKKVFIVLGVAATGAAITTGAAIGLASFGPIALTAAIITGVALTILATGLAIYFVTRSPSPRPIEKHYQPLPTKSAEESIPSPLQLIDGLGKDPQSVGKKLAEEAILKFEALNVPVSGHDVEDYAHSLIESQNRYALCQLNKKLREEVGETVASTIMNDWDLIGHDIRNNSALLDEGRINEILGHAKKAQAVKADKEGYNAQLNTLRAKLATGEMPARTLVIQKNFPLLAELIANDAQRKKELDTLLKEAAVKQQMRKGPLFQPSPGEKDIFERLGLPVGHIDPLKIPQSLSSKVALVLLESSPFFEESEEAFIGEVRKHIKKYAIEERIDQMTQKDSSDRSQKAKARVGQVQDLIRLRDHLNGRMRRQRRDIIKDLSQSLEEIKKCDDQQLKKLMTATLVSDVYKNSRLIMSSFLDGHSSEVQDAIDGDDEVESYHKKLTKVREEYIASEKKEIPATLNDGTKSKLPKVFDWYYKWIDNIEKPFSQGFEDKNEALGQGVCFAMSLRLIAYENTHPDATDEEIANHIQIKPQDRFFQALYSATKHSKLDDRILSHVGLKNLRVVDQFPKKNKDFLDRKKLLQHLSQTVKDSTKWKEINGVCSIGISGGKVKESKGAKKITNGWGHAIHTRIDTDRGIYRLFDPNFGLLFFHDEDQLVECLQELITSAYPDTFLAKMESYELIG